MLDDPNYEILNKPYTLPKSVVTEQRIIKMYNHAVEQLPSVAKKSDTALQKQGMLLMKLLSECAYATHCKSPPLVHRTLNEKYNNGMLLKCLAHKKCRYRPTFLRRSRFLTYLAL